MNRKARFSKESVRSIRQFIPAEAGRKEGEVDKTYNHFYAAMKAWGRYTLVDNPDDADQVFEIRFITWLSGTGKIDSFTPELLLTIVDAKTHFTLWTVAEPVEGAFLKSRGTRLSTAESVVSWTT